MLNVLFSLVTILFIVSGCSNQGDDSPKETKQVLKITSLDDPQSFDPRLVRDLPSVTVLNMLYEGLYRTSDTGNPEPALASEISVSEDRKTYTFYLRDSYWSDGTPVTSHDFIRTWKKHLTPSFPAPNAYQLYVIKGARAAREGAISLDEIGLIAPDTKTLVVELESPTPYFIELLTTHFFYPVSEKWEALSPNEKTTNLISNGPFQLYRYEPQNQLTVTRSSSYWDKSSVKIEEITIIRLDENAALQLFQNGEIDWVGSPLSKLPSDALQTLKATNELQVKPAAGTQWFRINTTKGPFINENIRRALALGIDRHGIVEHVLQGNEKPATGIIPPNYGLNRSSFFMDHDVDLAQKLFQQGLTELELSRKEFPPIRVSYKNQDQNHKVAQAVQQQWKNLFGIDVVIETTEGPLFFEQLKNGEFEIAAGSWFADINDPISFLEIFNSRDNTTNNTNWENREYTSFLNRSRFAATPERRKLLLTDAEAILMDQMPIIPLFFPTFNYLKREQLEDVYFSELGFLDFKRASIRKSIRLKTTS